MKTSKILTTLVAVCALAIGCTKEYAQHLDDIQLSHTMVALSAKEFDVCEVMVNAKAGWKIETEIPSWLSVTPTEGAAGETKVIITNPAGTTFPIVKSNNVTLKISCNGKTQYLMVQQGESAPLNDESTAFTADEVIQKYNDGVLSLGMEFYVKGVVKSAAIDTGYGNAEFYLVVNDHPGNDFELYRCMDLGGEKFTDANKVKAGDSVVAYGSLTEYKGLLELAQGCKLIKITKSEIELKNEDELTVDKDGGEITAKLVVNGGDFRFGNASDFITVKEVINIPEEKNDKGKVINPAMTGVVLKVAANEGGAREGTIDFMSGNSKITATIKQEGSIVELSCADFNAQADGASLYKISGFVYNNTAAGHKFDLTNYGNFDVKDASGAAYVYGLGAKGDVAALGIKEFDIITVQGTHSSYKDAPQMGSGQYVSHKSVTKVTAAEVAALADDDKADPKNYICLTGVVTNDTATASGHKFDLEQYGNFALVDESGSIYVYGVSTGWNGETKKFNTLGVKEGDTITIVAYKTSYNGAAQVVGMYVCHTPKE